MKNTAIKKYFNKVNEKYVGIISNINVITKLVENIWKS